MWIDQELKCGSVSVIMFEDRVEFVRSYVVDSPQDEPEDRFFMTPKTRDEANRLSFMLLMASRRLEEVAKSLPEKEPTPVRHGKDLIARMEKGKPAGDPSRRS